MITAPGIAIIIFLQNYAANSQKLVRANTELHRKAREWYQRNGLISEAIHHGTAEGNIEEVADLIEKNFFAVLEHRD